MSKSSRKRGRDPAVSVDDQVLELKKHKIFHENGELKTGKEYKNLWNTISANLKKKTGKKMNPHNIVNSIMQNRNGLIDKLKNTAGETTGLEQNDESHNCKEQVGMNNETEEDDKQGKVFDKLLEIRRNVLYRPVIKGLCQYPFTASYWSPKVVDLIDLCYDNETFVFFHAGIFTERFFIPDEYESKEIFAFILGCQVSKELIPLLHILTEETSESIFKRFLDEMMRSKCRIPKRIVIEHLFFMIQAVIQCFTKSSFYEEFLTNCFTCLQIMQTIKPSSCKVLDDIKSNMQINQTNELLSSYKIPESIDSHAQIEQDNNSFMRKDSIEDVLMQKQNDEEAKLQQIVSVCQVVINIRSVIMTVQTWDFTNFANPIDCKNFILKVILLMSQSESLADFGTILYKVIVVLESKYENKLSANYFNELSTMTQSNFEMEYELNSTHQILQRSSSSQTKIDFTKCQVIIEFLKTIRKQVQKDIAKEPLGILDNVFFNPTITSKVLELSVEFPLWTKVMDPFYSITSAQPSLLHSFKDYIDYFTNLSKNTCVMPIDEYLVTSIAYTNEKINYGISRLKATKTNNANKRQEHVKQDDSHLTPEENWRNVNYISEDSDDLCSNVSESTDSQSSDDEEQFFENTDGTNSSNDNLSTNIDSKQESHHGKINRKSKKKGALLNPCPQFCMLQQLPKQRTKKRSLIKNGNEAVKAVKVKSVSVRFLTTSPCDSLVEVIVSSFYLINKFQEYCLEVSKTSTLLTLIKEYAIDLKLGVFYRKRAEILSSFMTESLNEELYWNKSMAAFIEQTFIPSIKQTITCLTCRQETINRLSFITIDCQSLSNVDCVSDSLKSVPRRYCTFCGDIATVECNIENYLFCDVETAPNMAAYHLNNLPTEFSYNGKNFSLTGVISFEAGLVQPIQHYVAYCRSFYNDSWTKYDDSSNAIEHCTERQLTVQIAVLVYIEYELPFTKATTEHSDAGLPQNNDKDFQKTSSAISEDPFEEALTNELNVTYTTNKENSSNHLSLTGISNSDVEMPDNIMTSTPERQQISNSKVVDLTLERRTIEINNEKDISTVGGTQFYPKNNSMPMPDRKLPWKDNDLSTVTFPNPDDQEGEIISNRYEIQLSQTEINTSDMEIPVNVVTSTSERQQIAIDEVVDLTSEQQKLQINRTMNISNHERTITSPNKETKKPRREFTWENVESARVTFLDSRNEELEKNLNRGGNVRRLIRNGGRHTETIKIEIEKSTYYVKQFKNTCATDCIFEIMTDIASDGGRDILQDIYRNDTKNKTIQAIRSYCESFDLHKLLSYRAILMFKIHCSPDDILKNAVIDCQTNVCSRFRYLMNSFPCVTVGSNCSFCGKNTERKEATIAVDCVQFFLSNRIQDLQILVQEELSNKIRHCDVCIQAGERHTKEIRHIIGNYLAIEMDFLYEEAMKGIVYDELGIRLKDYYTNVKNIPLHLEIDGKKLLLKGIIEFEDPPNMMMHYIAYSRCLRTNSWTRYNDMLEESEFIRQNEMTHMKIALLLYVAS